MSGRKDYIYVLEAARIAAQAAAIAARRAERSRQTRARLERAKVDAKQRAERLGQQQRQKNQERLRKAAEQSRIKIETRQAEVRQAAQKSAERADQQAADHKVQQAKQAEIARQQEAQWQREAEAAAAKAAELQTEIENQTQAVLQWKQGLSENEDVQNFVSDRYADWQQRTEQIIDQMSAGEPTVELLAALQQAAADAEAVESRAGDVSDQFFSRNAVLSDIIDSLKEIGFFVQNPEFADPNHPEGAVIIRANRGNQNLTTSVSLDQKVESDWQGVHGEFCTGGFFEYVQAMNDRGVQITPNDPNLKPKLLQKGAKDLPGGQQKAAGGNL